MKKTREQYLTMEQITILLKCYYMKKCTCVAEDENMSPSKVQYIKSTALSVIRLAYSKSYREGKRFNGIRVLYDMAERAEMDVYTLMERFDTYISEGLNSDYKKYWKRIYFKDDIPKGVELLNFIYSKYEIEIEGII